MKLKIIKNVIRCRKCNDIIESLNRHDFKFCKCETVYIDGGLDYLKRGYKNTKDDYEDLSEYEVDCKECIYSLLDGEEEQCSLDKNNRPSWGCFVER